MDETNSLNLSIRNLEPFYQQEVIDLKEHPDVKMREMMRLKKVTLFNFSSLPMPIGFELKYYLQDILTKDMPHKTLMQYLRSLQHFMDFLRIESRTNENITLSAYYQEVEDEYKNYLESIGVFTFSPRTGKSIALKAYRNTCLFVMALSTGSDSFEKDIWELQKMGIESGRLSESRNMITLCFYTIPNETNRKFTKKYIKYLITTTDQAIHTIANKLNRIRTLLTFLKEKPLTMMNRSDVENFIENINERKLGVPSFNVFIFENIKFVEYLIASGDLFVNHIHSSDIKPMNRKPVYRSVDETVINQIFSVLDRLPSRESCMFLLLYSTGMRVSEVCAIKIDSIFQNNNGYFIRFHSQKMRKDAINPIPKSLYGLLATQKKYVLENYGKKTNYLFPYYNLKCYPSETFRVVMKKWFKDQRIKNADGTSYNFRTHDYRHTLATTMLSRDIPSSVIQKILHHESIEMTAAYIDIQDKQRLQRHKEFINVKGEAIPISIDPSMSIGDMIQVEFLKKTINAQLLPNGMCSLPVAMGKCPHGNSCLTCHDFRTNKDFLSVHQKHYEKVKVLLNYAKQQGWQRQIETNEEIRSNLETIIKRLQEESKEDIL